ncbi:MAG: cell wall hydrolase [Candidatus Brevundimonas phytovorans]|nr:cell wall hydrolase [Brevundimonas sp.]WEK57414.1 MAG: cell wall hydrolase [Brevundimonas sp.]
MTHAPGPYRLALLATALSAVLTGPTLAQTPTPPNPAPAAPSDPVADLLRRQGERYHRAPDAAQDPDELRQTQALNDEIVAQNDLAENEDRAAAAAHAKAQAQYQSELETAEAERLLYEADLRAAAEAKALYERQMADWQATVAACERGDRARCEAGRQTPR